MYVLSVCTALQFPAPTADSALTLTSYSVPADSLRTKVEFWKGEPEMVCWPFQEVVRCILYWRMYLETGSSLCGMAQVVRKAGNLDDTALDRDRPVTWEGTSKADRRKYVKFHYHRGTIHAVLLCIVTGRQHRQNDMYTLLEETAPKPPENPYQQVILQGQGFLY